MSYKDILKTLRNALFVDLKEGKNPAAGNLILTESLKDSWRKISALLTQIPTYIKLFLYCLVIVFNETDNFLSHVFRSEIHLIAKLSNFGFYFDR